MERKNELFRELAQIDVNNYVEQKNGLNYLSWANAIQEICKRHDEEFDYEIEKFGENKLPYVYDDGVGFMVFTKVTLCGKTRECWLPVMDNNNKAMKKEAYTYKTKGGDKWVEAATMFDVNKTIMRCLTKNLAMFGLGIYIYAGEDLPMEIEDPITAEQITRIRELGIIEPNVCKKFKVNAIEELSFQQAEFVINAKEKALEKEKSAKGDK